MDHVVVFKAAHHVDDGVHLADVGQKLVAQAFALAGTSHQAGDIDKLNPGGNDLLATGEFRQLLQPFIGHRHRAHIGLDGAEGEIGSLGLGVGHQGVEQGGLAHIGQSNDSGFEHGGNLGGRPTAHESHTWDQNDEEWLQIRRSPSHLCLPLTNPCPLW